MAILPSGFENLESALGEISRTGDGEWECKCPAHDDHKPSLWIKHRADKIVISCRAGCDWREVLAAANLEPGDLFLTDKPRTSRRIVAEYDYTDERGQVLFQSVRWEPKDFSQRRRPRRGDDPSKIKNGWIWKGVFEGTRKVLYHLPAVVASKAVILCEGEKDVASIEALGLRGVVATCNPLGAGYWEDSFTETLASKRVVILPDNDAPGREHAERISKALQGHAESVRIVHLDGLPEKGDASDWLAKHSRDEFIEALKPRASLTGQDAIALVAVALSGCSEAAAAAETLVAHLRSRGVLA